MTREYSFWIQVPNMRKKSTSPILVQEEGKVMRSRRRAYLLEAAIEGGEGRVARDLASNRQRWGRGMWQRPVRKGADHLSSSGFSGRRRSCSYHHPLCRHCR
jgi:hypothetical protein